MPEKRCTSMRTKKLRDTVTNWKLHIAHLKYLKIQHEKEEFQATSLKMQEEIDLLKAQKLVYEENQKKHRTKISSFAPKDTISKINIYLKMTAKCAPASRKRLTETYRGRRGDRAGPRGQNH